MWAAAGNNAAAVEALIEAGADVRVRTKYQTVQLFQTGGFGRRAERNSDVTKQSGFTALHFAVRAGALDAIKVLAEIGRNGARHDVGRYWRARHGYCQHPLRARGLADRAGGRSECGRTGVGRHSIKSPTRAAQYRRQQSWSRPERQARQPHPGAQADGARRRSEQRRRPKTPTSRALDARG